MYLSLNGDTISNNGEVFFSDIGTEDSGLLCITNRSGCCRSSDGVAQGQWYRPSGTRVGTLGLESAIDPMDHFYRDRGTRVVRLNRVGNPPERGRFRCEVPNADGDLVNLYVNIGEWFVSMFFFSIIISDAKLQQEVNVNSTKLIQARNQLS